LLLGAGMNAIAASGLVRRFLDAALPATLCTLAAAGCTPVYAPPVRGVAYGAPGRVQAGDVEIGGTMAGVYAPNAGSAHIAVGVHDWVSLEAGGTFAAAPTGPQSGSLVMAMGWIGPRFTLPRRPYGVSLLLDAELGLGAGVGGELCASNAKEVTVCDRDHLSPSSRGAFGGYQGMGLGLAYRWFSFYGRTRLEESAATGLPTTYWPSAMLGFGFDLAPKVSLDIGGGYLGYFDTKDSQSGWFYQTGLTVRFGRAR
jgi:hypothetical protein